MFFVIAGLNRLTFVIHPDEICFADTNLLALPETISSSGLTFSTSCLRDLIAVALFNLLALTIEPNESSDADTDLFASSSSITGSSPAAQALIAHRLGPSVLSASNNRFAFPVESRVISFTDAELLTGCSIAFHLRLLQGRTSDDIFTNVIYQCGSWFAHTNLFTFSVIVSRT